MNASEYLRQSEVLLDPNRYSVYRVNRQPEGDILAFLAAAGDLTAVALEGSLPPDAVLEEAPGWRLLSFRLQLPFSLTGFLAAVSQSLAAARVPIFALSSYDSDHLLIPEQHLEQAIRALSGLGCRLVRE